VDEEKWQGAIIRYWEDAQEGELLTPIVRARSPAKMLNFSFKTPIRSNRTGVLCSIWNGIRCVLLKDPASNIWEGWENQLLDDKVAKSMGFPFAHDCGLQRVANFKQPGHQLDGG